MKLFRQVFEELVAIYKSECKPKVEKGSNNESKTTLGNNNSIPKGVILNCWKVAQDCAATEGNGSVNYVGLILTVRRACSPADILHMELVEVRDRYFCFNWVTGFMV